MPIIPMVLVNGAEGIGTGWSTFIPNYNPADICANIRALLAGQPLMPMQVLHLAAVRSRNADAPGRMTCGWGRMSACLAACLLH